jgi:hypothetical protein
LILRFHRSVKADEQNGLERNEVARATMTPATERGDAASVCCHVPFAFSAPAL